MNWLRFIPLLLIATACEQPIASDNEPPPAPPSGQGDARGGPPPRMDTTTCQGKAAGDSAQVTTPDGRTLKGSCQLVFVPERPAGAPPEGKAR